MIILDSLRVEGGISHDPLLITAASQTTLLTVASQPVVVVSGSVAGQIVQLPSALTLNVGQRYEVWNLSSVPLTVQNGAVSPVVLARLSQARRSFVVLIDNSTQGGTWSVFNDVYGANLNFVNNAGPFTNSSNTTFVTAATFTTENLPLGEYRYEWVLYWTAANNQRGPDIQITDNGASQGIFSLFSGTVFATAYMSDTGFGRLLNVSGVRTINLEFRNSGGIGNSTITVVQPSLRLMRVA